MGMTRRDYYLIANTIRDNLIVDEYGLDERCERMAWDFAKRLAANNPEFKRDRFLEACGVLS